MEYHKFESKYDRRGAALHLAGRIQEQLANGRDPLDGWIPSIEECAELTEFWLPEDRFACQYQEGEEPCNWEHQSCGRRCSAVYWRKHCQDVADMMVALARVLGEPEDLWRATGLLHDLDYVRYPHHDHAISPDRSHPVGISSQLFEKGAPPIMILALLSHAPHLQLRPETALGWAVLGCDEHATMSGFGITPHYHKSIDPRITQCMTAPTGVLHGFHRNDMEGRANLAMLELSRVLEGKAESLQLSKNRWSPIDWDRQVQLAFS